MIPPRKRGRPAKQCHHHRLTRECPYCRPVNPIPEPPTNGELREDIRHTLRVVQHALVRISQLLERMKL